MRILLFLILGLASCKNQVIENRRPTTEVHTDWNKYFDEAGLDGATILYDPAKKLFMTNDSSYAHVGTLPASTFKIANTIVGLENELLSDTTTFLWDGQERSVSNWNQDLNLPDAFRYSCVPCYQHLARSTGVATMNQTLSRIGYPDMGVTEDNLDLFWLVGDTQINLYEQVKFISRLNQGKLPIKPSTQATLKQIMKAEENESYTLYGKTGWATGSTNILWYVGYIESKGKTIYFATRFTPREETPRSIFLNARVNITKAILKEQNLM